MSAADWLTSDAVSEALARIKRENEEETRSMPKVYAVWGGYAEQESGEHFADFGTLQDAHRYINKTRRANPRLILRVREQDRQRGD